MKAFFKSPIYQKMPAWEQNSYLTLKGLVFNFFRAIISSPKFYKALGKNEFLREEQLKSFQLSKLRELVRYAGANIPWYREVFKETGFDSASPFSFEDYARLPILEKKTLIANNELFLPKNIKRKFTTKAHSSGTTGNSLFIRRDLQITQAEWAFARRQYRWAGIPENSRIAFLRDDRIVPLNTKNPPYSRQAWLNKELWLSSFHLNKETAKDYINELRNFRVQGIFAYPSSIYWLSVFAHNAGIDALIPSLKGIVVSSEKLYDFQKKSITEAFKVPVFDWYGNVERVIFIGTCEKGTKHLFPDYGHTEFIPSGTGDGQVELIGTGFYNSAMPLLRYRTGDIAKLSDNKCTCGRYFPVVEEIFGRANDAILTPDGHRIAIIEIFNHVTQIEQLQITQESTTELTVSIVPKDDFSKKDELEIVTSLQEVVGPKMIISTKIANRIPGGPFGKYRMVVSKL